MSSDQKALEAFKIEEYKVYLKEFKKAAMTARTVQSLTNLAWIYSYQGEDDRTAMSLLEEVIAMNPDSHFPYSLLGEIYVRKKEWKPAQDTLLQALAIHPTKAAYNNLAVAQVQLGNLKEAANNFLLAEEGFDWSMYGHIKILIDVGNLEEAESKLDLYSEKDHDLVGFVDLADLYVEIGSYAKAIAWFEKDWDNLIAKDPTWVNRYIYALYKTNNLSCMQEIIEEVSTQLDLEMKEAWKEEIHEEWSELEKNEYIQALRKEKEEYEQAFLSILDDKCPALAFDYPIKGACYLFGYSSQE
ncbi:tetratricopeptide repeat protein [Planococcus shixiaomingii]|uniref:tetratricopeptide repeat protein n=1 Tax=Planococcus shixiaomingii TaxID=3058393 RepID=UPI002614847E|nr:tetratricopeptide repeat protein [Planococcus sp. N022]WKA53215.1 tetratricopeptide repeat protein [Planococcus sp. N022]